MVVVLIITLKCFSLLTKTLVPLTLAEFHNNANTKSENFEQIEEIYSLSYENAYVVVILFTVLYNWLYPSAPSNLVGRVAILFQVKIEKLKIKR